MTISLTDLGKRYNYEWIFRHVDLKFTPGEAYAILGHNGSGKSTLLNTISGNLLPSEGKVNYNFDGRDIDPDQFYRYISYASPYLELVEEYTLTEVIEFHSRFKKLKVASPEVLIERMQLQKARHKYVKDFSSGMKQRLKLGLAIFSEAPVLLLDEPTTNLDQDGINWYLEHVTANRENRIVIISSNVAQEYSFCDERIRIIDYHHTPSPSKKQA
jgi:ABC-type multidrug transport system ATPase subunit